MKTIGLIGGLSWESTAQYYKLLNQGTQQILGGVHSAQILLWSFDFATITRLQHAGDWTALSAQMIHAARQLAAGGVDLLLICSNTMHLMAAEIEQAAGIPLLHIADPTGTAIRAAGHRRVGLLGTAFTMEQDFYRARLAERFGLDVLIPQDAERATVHRIIYEELVRGQINPDSRAQYQAVIAQLVARGAEAVILGCTEIMLLIDAADSPVPLFDTTSLHARAAVSLAVSGA